MRKEDVLEDGSLEALGLIKEIDTLSIIQKGEEIKEKKRNKLNNIMVVLLAIIIGTMNFEILIRFGIKIFVIIQVILSWSITIMFLPLFKRKLYRRS